MKRTAWTLAVLALLALPAGAQKYDFSSIYPATLDHEEEPEPLEWVSHEEDVWRLKSFAYEIPKKLASAAGKLEQLVVLDFLGGPLAMSASVLLPGASFAEKSGTWINNRNRVQLVHQAIECPGRAQEDVIVLQQLLREVAGEGEVRAPADIFAELGEAHPALEGLTHWKIRRGGRLLEREKVGSE